MVLASSGTNNEQLSVGAPRQGRPTVVILVLQADYADIMKFCRRPRGTTDQEANRGTGQELASIDGVFHDLILRRYARWATLTRAKLICFKSHPTLPYSNADQ